MLNNEIKRQIDSARNILVGKVPDPKAQVEQITTALIYKFMDDMDRENMEVGLEPQFFTKEYKEFAWSKLMDSKMSGQGRLDLYVRAISNMPQNPHIPQLFRDIFKGAFLPFRDARTLNLFIKEINNFHYDNSENLGNAFEYLLSILGSQGDAGQFRTPRHIIDFIVSIIEPKKKETILDPACGTAGFLISSFKHILKTNSSETTKENGVVEEGETATETIIADKKVYTGDLLSPNEKIKLTKNINGYDISPDMVKLALVNLYLHGFKEPQIYEYDTLSDEKRWDEDYDVILANPPFMTPKGGIAPHKRFSVQARRSEVLFVDYIAEHLKIGGRAGIIVPEGIIFQSSKAYKNLRKNLIENWGLWAVISLPSGVFQPYSGVKTSILILDKALAKHNKEILFVKIDNDGFDLGAQRRKIDKNDLPKALEILKNFKNSPLRGVDSDLSEDGVFSLLVPKSKLAENGDYNLSGDRYRESKSYSKVKYPLVEIGEVFNIESGGTPSSKNKDYWSGNIKWATLADIPLDVSIISHTKRTITEEGLKKSSAKLLPQGTVLVSSRATIGRIAVINCEMATNQGFKNILIDEKNNSLFVAYVLSSQVDRMIQLATGGTFKEISKAAISKIKIPLPPLEIQKQIVAEIEQYQKVIDGARQVVDNWKPKIEINIEWNFMKVGEIVEFISGVTLSVNSCLDENGYPLITIADVSEEGQLKEDNIRKVATKKKKNFLQKGDLLFNWRNGSKHLVGKTALFDLEGDYIFASFLLGVRPNKKKILSNFLWVLLNQYRRTGKYIQFMRENVNGLFNREELKDVLVPVPSIEIQRDILSQIAKEKEAVSACQLLIDMMESKIEEKIGEVWGKN